VIALPGEFQGKHGNQDIGLYTREQEKNTIPFQYFAQIVVGAVVFLCGVLFLGEYF
jgi:hypothetical protein